MIDEKKRCPACHSLIYKKAKVCPHCSTHLGRGATLLNFLKVAGPIVAVAAVVISYFQFQDARRETVAAEEALVLAETALQKNEAVEKRLAEAIESLSSVESEVTERRLYDIAGHLEDATVLYESCVEKKGLHEPC